MPGSLQQFVLGRPILIDNAEGGAESGKTSWTPIGNYDNSDPIDDNGSQFTGIFDGGGHSITGLYINSEVDNYQGLFGFAGNGGAVRNLSVSGEITEGWFAEDSDTAWDFANDKVTKDITLTARWTAVCTVTIGTPENGTIKADKEKAEEGATVTLTVPPNNGWQLKADSLKVTDADGKEITVNDDNTFMRTM